jgi:D-aminopeptidase
VGALVAVNALGSAVVPGGRQFWAAPFEFGDEFGGLGVAVDHDPGALPVTKHGPARNTTIAIVATDVALTQAEAKRMAIAAHDGMARARLSRKLSRLTARPRWSNQFGMRGCWREGMR